MTTNDDDPTRIPPGLYSAITALASCSFEESWSLCQSLVEIIRNATEDTSVEARDSLLYSYTVKRLMRGLASTSEATRSNFASALFCIFTDIGALPFSKTVALVDAQLPLSAVASVRRAEQTAMLKGRLIAFNILFEFCSGDPGDLTTHLNRIQQEVIQLFLKHKGIERLAHHTLSKLHCRLPRSGADPIRKDGEMSNKQRALALLYHKVDFKDEDAAWKLSTRASSLGGSLQAFYIYALSLLRSLMRANDPGAFESVWKSICRKVNKSEKRWLPLVRGLLIDLLPDDCVNDNFVAAILGSSSFVRALAARSEDFVFILKYVCKFDRCVKLLVTRLVPHRNVPLVCGALGSLDGRRLQKSLNSLIRHDGRASPSPYFFDLMLGLTRMSETRDGILGPCIEHLLKHTLGFMIEDKVRERVHGILLGIMKDDRSPTWQDVESRVDLCLTAVQNAVLAGNVFDRPFLRLFEQGLQLLEKVQCPAATDQQIITNFCKVALILTAIEPAISVSLIEELQDCIHAIGTGRCVSDEAAAKNPYDVLVDILMSWLSQRSALLRLFSDALFGQVASRMTPISMDSIAAVLAAKPGQDEDGLLEEGDGSDKGDFGDEQEMTRAAASETSEDDDAMSIPSSDKEPTRRGQEHAKRQKVQLPEESPSEESDIVDLDTAGEQELQLLDQQLGAIMAARKKAKVDPGRDLFQFKQRLADWIIVLLKEGSSDEMRLSSVLIEAIVAHCAGPAEKRHRSTLEAELVSKLYQILRSVNKSMMAKPIANDEASKRAAAHHLKVILASLDMAKLSAGDISRLSPSIRTILLRVDRTEASVLLDAAWHKLVSDLKSRHASGLLPLWQEIRSTVPDVLLLQLAKDLPNHGISKLRPKELSLLVDLALASFKEASSANCLEFLGAARRHFMARLSETPNLLAYARDGLPLLYKVMSRSKVVLQEGAINFWSGTLETIKVSLTQLANTEGIQANQLASLYNRLGSAKSILEKQ